jgi:hypothetical protein
LAGKSIYFTEKELKMLKIAFSVGDFIFDGIPEEEQEERYSAIDSIRDKIKQ